MPKQRIAFFHSIEGAAQAVVDEFVQTWDGHMAYLDIRTPTPERLEPDRKLLGQLIRSKLKDVLEERKY